MLRWIFILVLLANAVFFALFYQDITKVLLSDKSPSEGPSVSLDDQQNQPKTTRIIDPQKVTKIETDDQICIEIYGFVNQSSLVKTSQWLKNQGLFPRERTRVVVSEQSFRLYINNFTTRNQAEKGLRVLQRTTGKFDGSVVYQHAPNDWRISLIVFSSEQRAQSYLDSIQQQAGELDIKIEAQTKSNEESYLILTDATGKKFLLEYQSPKWQQHLAQERLKIDQCLLR